MKKLNIRVKYEDVEILKHDYNDLDEGIKSLKELKLKLGVK